MGRIQSPLEAESRMTFTYRSTEIDCASKRVKSEAQNNFKKSSALQVGGDAKQFVRDFLHIQSAWELSVRGFVVPEVSLHQQCRREHSHM